MKNHLFTACIGQLSYLFRHALNQWYVIQEIRVDLRLNIKFIVCFKKKPKTDAAGIDQLKLNYNNSL